jgi:hypothetical protein
VRAPIDNTYRSAFFHRDHVPRKARYNDVATVPVTAAHGRQDVRIEEAHIVFRKGLACTRDERLFASARPQPRPARRIRLPSIHDSGDATAIERQGAAENIVGSLCRTLTTG